MIDYDYEQRLVDRITANEAAKKLSPRQRRILTRYVRYGETFAEIGRREGVVGGRIQQIHARAVRRLQKSLTSSEPVSVSPHRTTANTPPPGFDRSAFLRHMQGLITRREAQARLECQWREERDRLEREREELARKRAEDYARNWRQREREALDEIMRPEEVQGRFAPPPPPRPAQPQYTHWVVNSPSYAPPPLPTRDELSRMAYSALQYLLLARPQHVMGTPWLGEWATSVVFTRDGGSVTEAVNSIVRELPSHAHLSAFPVPIENGVLGANATNPYASLRVTITPDGLRLRFDVTWD